MKLLGEVYKEKVLTLPQNKRKRFEIPLNSGVTKIENDIFGWRLFYRKLGRKKELPIECRSEDEARYIKLFMELFATEVYIPKDDEYLRTVLEELEELKLKTDNVLNNYLQSLLRKSHREKLKFMVYKEVLGEPVSE